MSCRQQSGPVLWQRFLHVESLRKGKDLLEVGLFFQETSREDRLKVEIFIKDFTIKDVVLERPRSIRGAIKPLSLLFLHGRSVYLGEARNLKRAILEWGETRHSPWPSSGTVPVRTGFLPPLSEREHFAELFLELIANVLQTEIFLLPERGFSSVQEYDRYFSKIYAGACRLYSKPRGKLPENAYTQGQERPCSLFSRSKSIFIFQPNDTKKIIHAHLSDSFHEMALSLSVSNSSDPPYYIEEAKGNYLRFPNPACREAAEKLQELEGMHLLPDNKKQIISVLTGPEGCSHLSDLVIEAARSLQEWEISRGLTDNAT